LAIVLSCGAAAAGARAAEPLSPDVMATAGIGAFAPEDPIDSLLAKAAPQSDAAPVSWTTGKVRLSPKSALRISVADPFIAPGERSPRLPGHAQDAQAYEVSVVRDWPAALSFKTRRFGFDLSPHAGVGLTSYGGLAEAGATLDFSQRVDQAAVARLGAMGVRDGATLGGKGRWYLFAAASGRSVGLNMLRSETGWDRAGWTTDPSSTLVGDAQVGVGWRKGAMQTSLGFVHREIKGLHTIYGQDPKADSMVAFSFAVRPRR
jgi:hypothetical protein